MSNSLGQQVKTAYPNLVAEALVLNGSETVIVKPEGIKPLALSLRDSANFKFEMLMELFVVDYLHWEEKEKRFEVVYNLFSLTKNHRLFVKVPLAESAPELESVVSVWPAADWYEREAWDMFGIVFKGHPNLKRILMYEGFKGHALRKDYRYNLRQPIIGPVN